MKVAMPALLGFLLGCTPGPVVVDGIRMNRMSHTFVGQPFHITHNGAHPRPGSPSGGLSADGGEIAGNVCGVSMNIGVRHEKDRVEVSGFVDGQYLMDITIREVDGYRVLNGNLAYHTVDLKLFGDRVMGWIGHCRIDMSNESEGGSYFARAVNIKGNVHKLYLDGVDALWAMPAADQAATLPLLLHCQLAQLFNFLGSTSPRVGFGGQESALPIGTVSFVSKNTYCR